MFYEDTSNRTILLSLKPCPPQTNKDVQEACPLSGQITWELTLIGWQLRGPLLLGSPQLRKLSASPQMSFTQRHTQPGKPTAPPAELPLGTAHVRIRICQQKRLKETLFYFRTMLGFVLTLNSCDSQFRRFLHQSRITISLGEWKLLCDIVTKNDCRV